MSEDAKVPLSRMIWLGLLIAVVLLIGFVVALWSIFGLFGKYISTQG